MNSLNDRTTHYSIGYETWILKDQITKLLPMALEGTISIDLNKKLQGLQALFIPAIDCLRLCFVQFTVSNHFSDTYYFPDQPSCPLVPIPLLARSSDRLIKLIHQRIREKRTHEIIKPSKEDLQELTHLFETSCIGRIRVLIIKRLKKSKNNQEIATLDVLNQYFMRLLSELTSFLQEIQGGAA